MSFLEYQFPTKLALMAVGGPAYSTNINAAFSGYEQRQKNWSLSRSEYTVSFEHKTQTDYDALLAMFHAAQGMANSFRLYDHSDYSGTGQYIGTGDGATVSYQLQKTYTFGGSVTTIRPIQKPITTLVKDFYGNALTDTVAVYVNGVAGTHDAGYHTAAGKTYLLDETTGIITFLKYGLLTITAITKSGNNCTYAYSATTGSRPVIGQQIVITGMSASSGANNGTFLLTAVTSTTFTVVNASGVNETHAGTGSVYLGKLTLTAAAQSGSNTTYTVSATSGVAVAIGQRVTVFGFTTSGNNGTFYVTATGTGTFTVVNASGANETHAGTAYTDSVPKTGHVITADYSYHVPVRFDLDGLQSIKETSKAAGILYTVTGIKLVEVRIALGSSS